MALHYHWMGELQRISQVVCLHSLILWAKHTESRLHQQMWISTLSSCWPACCFPRLARWEGYDPVCLHVKLHLTILDTWCGCWPPRHSKSSCMSILFFYACFYNTGFILQTSCLATVLRDLEISSKFSHQTSSSRWECNRILFQTIDCLSWWEDSFLLLWKVFICMDS